MNEDVLNTIEILINKFDENEKWATNHKMGLYSLLQKFGYDYERDESGKLKVIKEENK